MFSRIPTPITLRVYVRSFTTATPLKPPTVTAPHYSRPLKMALLGAPGVGKGTFASRIGPYFGLPGISTGDLIRAEIKTGSPRGQSLKLITDRGGLIDDSIVLEMLMQRLSQPDCIHGFILDGYPRRISQAQALQAVCRLDLVLNIGLREDILITKATARRVCGVCGAGYNFANIENGPYRMPPLLPKIKDTCDKCGAHPLPLVQRSDDTESTVRERLVTYHRETAPLIDYYEKQGLLTNWEVKQGLGDWNDMRDMLRAIVDQKMMDQPVTSTPTSTTTAKVSCPR